MTVEVTVRDIKQFYKNIKATQETLEKLEYSTNYSFKGSDKMKWCIYGNCDQEQVQTELDEYVKAVAILADGFAAEFECTTASGGGGSWSNRDDKIEMAKYVKDGCLYSRALAKKIINDMDKTGTVILDFDGIGEVIRSFADELFRVGMNKHEGLELEIINADPALCGLIRGFAKQREEIRVTFVD